MSEKEWMAQVLQLADLLGWLCYHTHDSRRSREGFPDLVLAKAGRRTIFAELKTETGATTPAQDRWIATLRAAGDRVFVWRPADLLEVAQTLRE
ncbi:vrr-nuc domain-containing protein : VRR-NUC domain-containing protein OS=Cellvibrio gilvus (strain ATCC 13127 / NRRL B-14078) GN=Celgi_1314 PE=4 SV=1: VRR_NUC [Gemmataceae bacterium]|nr:vrr-nuc domain-containing protein : VRR-NUC domain-containing protein OS=Cellvibrio gilvus (strain ATCC 13127 / NRRL B-14078) GN=Celgi_1314 PE=4 SV=1: VRR_NUC [Gemmataceae bacterium]VTT96529.1 vrr-nuc domain-containing protein : VRR-NUC domain-containing protein OS=Cellvibrio gilvus (strain ATCC 13127 / NRRL B-14078) GN=Celgi_1314 PE=4 SV=1: VRR_NUC [Gemmataceae bacterium]